MNKKLIKTPTGLKKYSGIRKMLHDSYYEFTFSNNKKLICSKNHPFITYNGVILAKNLTKKNEIFSTSGGIYLKRKKLVRKKIWLYDALNTYNNVYYTNDILSHNCDFLGSSNTLISASKLSTLAWKKSIKRIDGLDVYETPIKNHLYVISVDTAEGQGLDHSAFTVIDCTQSPYKVVAKYYNNTISPLVYPTIIHNIGRMYNDAYALVETNSIGTQIVNILHSELEYENIFSTTNMGRGGQKLSSGFKKNAKLGVKMTHQIKSIGCANLKSMIENDKLIIEDFDIISELTSFVSKHSTFSAEAGTHDDLVMSLVLFSWLSAQLPFKQLTDTDIRKKIIEDNNSNVEEEILPFGFINNGSIDNESFIDSDGDVWEPVDKGFFPLSTGSYSWDDE
jgi:hypothetical protein